MPLQPGTTLGPYRVTAKIGEGGMGQFFQATDTTLNPQVALRSFSRDQSSRSFGSADVRRIGPCSQEELSCVVSMSPSWRC